MVDTKALGLTGSDCGNLVYTFPPERFTNFEICGINIAGLLNLKEDEAIKIEPTGGTPITASILQGNYSNIDFVTAFKGCVEPYVSVATNLNGNHIFLRITSYSGVKLSIPRSIAVRLGLSLPGTNSVDHNLIQYKFTANDVINGVTPVNVNYNLTTFYIARECEARCSKKKTVILGQFTLPDNYWEAPVNSLLPVKMLSPRLFKMRHLLVNYCEPVRFQLLDCNMNIVKQFHPFCGRVQILFFATSDRIKSM